MRRQAGGSRSSSTGATESGNSLGAQRTAASKTFEAPPANGDLLKIAPADIAPCPLNIRLDYGDIEELRDSIARLGILENGIVANRELFVRKYPDCAERTLPRPYVAIFGHRRREAAEGLPGIVMPMVLRDDIVEKLMVEEVMAGENHERKDLSPVEEAMAIRQYQNRHEVSAEDAGKTLYGYAKGTVSKRMRLLKLHPDLQQAVHKKLLGTTDAYLLAKELTDDQAAQLEAWRLIQEEKLTAEAAVNRLRRHAVREEENEPAPASVADVADHDSQAEVVPPQRHPSSEEHQGSSSEQSVKAGEGGQSEPEVSAGNSAAAKSTQQAAKPNPATIAARLRDEACRAVCKLERPAPAEQTTRRLATSVLTLGNRDEAVRRAHNWLQATGHAPTDEHCLTYVEDVLAGEDANLTLRVAFAIALAEDEIRASQPERAWDRRDAAHLDLLITRGGHAPTEWEQQRLDEVSAGNLIR